MLLSYIYANSVIPNKSAPDNSSVAILHFRQTSNNCRFKMFCLSCSPVLSAQAKDVVSNKHFCQFSNGSGYDYLPRFLFHCCYSQSLTIITQFTNAGKTTCGNLSFYRHI